MTRALSRAQLARIADVATAMHIARMKRRAPEFRPTAEYLKMTRRGMRSAAPLWVAVFRKMGWRPEQKRKQPRRGTKRWRGRGR